MAKKRNRKKGANPVREWISDNLRYLLLILIVVIAALAAFLIYREVSDRRAATAAAPAAEATVTPAATASSSSEKTEEKTEEAPSSSTEVVTATPTPTAAPTETPEPTSAADLSLTEMVPAATEAVQNYFYNMQAEGENEAVEYYDSIHVQTCPGPAEGTYIAYADYEYKYWNYDTMVPGLTEFYLAPDAEGNLQAVSEVPADVQAYIANVRQTVDVQKLITDVQGQYQETLDADPELSEYISGLG